MNDRKIIARRVTVLLNGYWHQNSERNVVFKVPGEFSDAQCRAEADRRYPFEALKVVEVSNVYEVRAVSEADAACYLKGDNS